MFARNLVKATFAVAKFTPARNFAKLAGTVKFFDPVKGFGFISPNDGSEDIFVHQSEIQATGFRSLNDGEQVEFNVMVNEQRGGKKFASNVTGPNGANVQGTVRPNNTGLGGNRERRPRDGGY